MLFDIRLVNDIVNTIYLCLETFSPPVLYGKPAL
jgi:hypothetical protein